MHTPHSASSVLTAAGFLCDSCEADWQDVGGPESGPKLVGHPAADYWHREEQYVVYTDGKLTEQGVDSYWNYVPEPFEKELA